MPTTEERICSLQIGADLIVGWTLAATGTSNKEVRDILARSGGQLNFFPSETAKLAASAFRCLPGHNDLTGIDVAAKFRDRVLAFAPSETPTPLPPAREPDPDDGDAGENGDVREAEE